MLMQPAAAVPGGGVAVTWKLVERSTHGGGFFTLSEFQWLDSSGNPISTSGATHTASTAQAGSVGNLFDGNTSTFYQTGTVSNAFIQTVFASPVTVAGVKLTDYAGFTDRAPAFFDVYYDAGAGDVYLFSGAIEPWVANTAFTFMDPGGGAQTDWLVMPTALNGAAGWFQAELELRASLGGADEATGGTAYGGYGFNFDVPSKLYDNNTTTFSGATSIATTPWVYAGYQLTTAKDIQQVAALNRSGNLSQSMTAGKIYAGANRGFRLRKTFSGLTWPADPTTNLINL
jgi:hypothetical protein